MILVEVKQLHLDAVDHKAASEELKRAYAHEKHNAAALVSKNKELMEQDRRLTSMMQAAEAEIAYLTSVADAERRAAIDHEARRGRLAAALARADATVANDLARIPSARATDIGQPVAGRTWRKPNAARQPEAMRVRTEQATD